MPDKHPNAERWGGPGASHEDASKPQPEKKRLDETHGHQHRSDISGGGGELDEHHTHDPKHKS